MYIDFNNSPRFIIIQRQEDGFLQHLFPGHGGTGGDGGAGSLLCRSDIVQNPRTGRQLVGSVVQNLARIGLQLVWRQNDITVAVILAVAAGNGNLKKKARNEGEK